MLVYDITNMNSFQMLQKWNHTIEEVSNLLLILMIMLFIYKKYC